MKRLVILFLMYHLVALVLLPMVVTWFVGTGYEIEILEEVDDVIDEIIVDLE